MCISSNTYTERNYKFDFTKLEYSKTPEEEREEQLMVATAEDYLESLGIKIKTDYGYYRDTYSILKDLGKYLIENNICKASPLAIEKISRVTTGVHNA